VEEALKELDGVTSAVVNLGLNTARVTYIPGVVSVSAMKRAVREAGYEALERSQGLDALDRERQAREDEIRRQGRNLIIAGIVGLIVATGTFYDMLGQSRLCRVALIQMGHRIATTPLSSVRATVLHQLVAWLHGVTDMNCCMPPERRSFTDRYCTFQAVLAARSVVLREHCSLLSLSSRCGSAHWAHV
jgi:copper chaperone CopZ